MEWGDDDTAREAYEHLGLLEIVALGAPGTVSLRGKWEKTARW